MATAAGTPTKPRTEAQKIITRLQLSGMKQAEIARQLGITAQTVKDIARGKASGDAHLVALRSLHNFAPTKTPTGEATTHNVPRPTVDDSTQAAIPTVDAEEAPTDTRSAGQRFKDAMKDALTGKAHDSARAQLSTATKRVKSSGDGVNNDDLVDQLVPLLALASVILTQLAIPERYSAVGPTHEESSAMLRPVVRVMTRQLEVAGQLTETQMDVLAALAALGLYADRAWHTYKDIRATEGRVVDEYPNNASRRADNGRAAQPGARPAGTHGGYSAPSASDALRGNYAVAASNAGREGARSPFGGGQAAGGQAQHHLAPDATDRQRGGSVSDGDSQAVGQRPDPFASLYAADAAGRRQLGIN